MFRIYIGRASSWLANRQPRPCAQCMRKSPLNKQQVVSRNASAPCALPGKSWWPLFPKSWPDAARHGGFNNFMRRCGCCVSSIAWIFYPYNRATMVHCCLAKCVFVFSRANRADIVLQFEDHLNRVAVFVWRAWCLYILQSASHVPPNNVCPTHVQAKYYNWL